MTLLLPGVVVLIQGNERLRYRGACCKSRIDVEGGARDVYLDGDRDAQTSGIKNSRDSECREMSGKARVDINGYNLANDTVSFGLHEHGFEPPRQ